MELYQRIGVLLLDYAASYRRRIPAPWMEERDATEEKKKCNDISVYRNVPLNILGTASVHVSESRRLACAAACPSFSLPSAAKPSQPTRKAE
jgi:hypothetical protein